MILQKYLNFSIYKKLLFFDENVSFFNKMSIPCLFSLSIENDEEKLNLKKNRKCSDVKII